MATEGKQLRDGGNVVAAANLYNPATALPGPNGSGQFCAVVLTGARTINVASTAGVPIYGVLQNTPLEGDPADVCLAGVTKGVAGAAIAAEADLAVDANGRFITATSGAQIVGKALEAAGAAGEVFTMYAYSGGYPKA